MGIKVTIVGAGSTVFMRNIVRDMLQKEALRDIEISLYDIDAGRLEESQIVANRLVEQLQVPARITATLDRRDALRGATVVFTLFQVGGYKPSTLVDFEVPRQFGLDQTIADTLGVGGIMRGLRTVPVMLELAADMRELCPDAWLLNYVNPMAIISWAMHRLAPDINYVGLCHSVQHTSEELAQDLGEDIADIVYDCAGINHMAFFTRFDKRLPDGGFESLYPRLQEIAGGDAVPAHNRVRYEIMRRFGYFVTESSEHFAEYTPWFIKRDRPDLIEKFGIPLDEYPKRCVEQIARWENQANEYRSANAIVVEPSREYASSIVNSVWTGEPSVIYGNVRNEGYITSLPDGAAVEVPCLVDRSGIQPTHVGALPPQLTAIIRTNLNVQELTVQALLTENREHVYQAAMMDPHTAAELDLDQIWALVDDLIEAHGDWLPPWTRRTSSELRKTG
jgi:alpha-galactosidase